MKQLATITVIGRDKTGVVARVTSLLFEQKANIEGLEEQVTRGQFSMTVQVSWRAAQVNRAAVCGGLDRLADALDMEIKVRFTDGRRRQRMVIMVTREPHCLLKLIEGIKSGALGKAEPALVLSNRRDLEPIARKAGLSFAFVPWDDRLRALKAVRLYLDRRLDVYWGVVREV